MFNLIIIWIFLWLLDLVVFSLSRENLDISQVASERGVAITNTSNLIQAIMVGQSVLLLRESKVEEMGWALRPSIVTTSYLANLR